MKWPIFQTKKKKYRHDWSHQFPDDWVSRLRQTSNSIMSKKKHLGQYSRETFTENAIFRIIVFDSFSKRGVTASHMIEMGRGQRKLCNGMKCRERTQGKRKWGGVCILSGVFLRWLMFYYWKRTMETGEAAKMHFEKWNRHHFIRISSKNALLTIRVAHLAANCCL